MPATLNRGCVNRNIESHVQVLSYLFKGLLVVASPIVGWAILKCIFLIFTHPQYFFFAWLAVLGIGLVAQFVTQSWCPGGNSGNRPDDGSDQGCNEVVGNRSPTVLFKSFKVGGETGSSEGFNNRGRSNGTGPADIDEADTAIVQLATSLQITDSHSSSETGRGFGKPVLLKVDYQLGSRGSRSRQRSASETIKIGKTGRKTSLSIVRKHDSDEVPTLEEAMEEEVFQDDENENTGETYVIDTKLTTTVIPNPTRDNNKGDSQKLDSSNNNDNNTTATNNSNKSNLVSGLRQQLELIRKDLDIFIDENHTQVNASLAYSDGVDAMEEEIERHGMNINNR